MRNSTKQHFRYTWDKIIANVFWFTVFMVLLIKVVESLATQG